jgi:hypothetical protein
MGTTLTGTTPQDTYDSLIKVTDNGPLSATGKYLSDGLGNDSVLALSTAAVGIGTTAPVGILDLFKSAAATRLAIRGDAGQNRLISYRTGSVQRFGLYVNNTAESGANAGSDFAVRAYNDAGTLLSTPLFIKRSTGNVGIGTSTPAQKLEVSGNILTGTDNFTASNGGWFFNGDGSYTNGIFANTTANNLTARAPLNVVIEAGGGERVRVTANGLTFNGDTAAANALDDYEEGTWTATLTPFTSGTITLNVNSGTYTKIGREVTIKTQIRVGSVASPVGAEVAIGGFPFTIIDSNAGRGAGSATYFPSVGSGSLLLNYQLHNALGWNLVLTASTIAAGDEFYLTLTYFA